MLMLDNIDAGYGATEVLKVVSLDVAAGEIVALLGPNGAGKSMVLKVIAGLLTPGTGTVTLCEQDNSRKIIKQFSCRYSLCFFLAFGQGGRHSEQALVSTELSGFRSIRHFRTHVAQHESQSWLPRSHKCQTPD